MIADQLLLTALLDASVDGIHAFDRNYNYIAFNSAMERISGVKRADVLGRNAFEVFPFLKQIGADHDYQRVLAGESVIAKARPYAIPESSRNGFFEGFYFPLKSGDEIIGGIGVIRDVTQQKLAEDAAREEHQRLTFHVENSPLAVIEWDSDFRVSRWSEAAERLFGWKPEEVIGKHVSDWKFVYPEDVDSVSQVTNRQREGVERRGVLFNRNYTKEGEILHCEWYNSVLNDEHGRLVSVLSLVLNITPRKIAEAERGALLVREREARKQAEDADRLKDEFLATLSHELRTPLTAVLGWASLMRSGDVPETEFPSAVEIIERNARAQARLIDDLLDVSRIITGHLLLELRPVDLIAAVEAVGEAVAPAALAKNVRLQIELETETQSISADPSRLRQVIWNLLLNAIKFTPRGGSVTVKIEADESHARLIVSDTGEGITLEFLPHVFDRFRQAEGSIARKHGGLGLGLAVARHLVELHGGSIRANSAGPGKGATFTVELPLKAATPEQGSLEVVRSRWKDIQGGKARELRDQLKGLRVLVVEDDADSRTLIKMMLERHGAEVESVGTAEQALKAIDAVPPDVLISDIGMPDQDGFELIRRLRNMSASLGGQMPAIALTGYATTKDRDRAIAEGFQKHLAKPVEPAELVDAIVKLTRRGNTA